jgi:hypothetical protein
MTLVRVRRANGTSFLAELVLPNPRHPYGHECREMAHFNHIEKEVHRLKMMHRGKHRCR